MIKAYWCSNDNFGDAATPYIIKKLSGEKAKFIDERDDKTYRCLVTGSIIGLDKISKSLVWGCGMPWKTDKLKPAFAYLMVRGPLTFKRVIKQTGYKAACIGDPVLLLPRLYSPVVEKKYKLGIIPSWIDMEIAKKYYADSNYKIINIMKPVEHVIDSLSECETTICSCLHGIIACAAYGVPTRWVEFSDRVVGDGTKFRDFAASCGLKNYDPVNLRNKLDDLSSLPIKHPLIHNLDQMLDMCPFYPNSKAYKNYFNLINT